MLLIEITSKSIANKNKLKKVLTSFDDFDILIKSLDSSLRGKEQAGDHQIEKIKNFFKKVLDKISIKMI